ncbi:MAG: glycosyltransferase family 2 protein [Lachnospiraceae bacterium]|jgi:glycosyltransferase involved in cell wall biosynthesis|nr:glycosyltransferase family 2 protein [Lachnospiraceae bacterium]
MDKAKVSVIIPIYNVEKYIAECVESVQKQTLKEIEIICVNDGSLDNSMKIVGKMALKDKRIKIINKMNGGLSSARNAGFAEAGGAYVLFSKY